MQSGRSENGIFLLSGIRILTLSTAGLRMVRVGTIYWQAEIRGADKAETATDDLSNSFVDTAESAHEAKTETSSLDTGLGLLSSAATFAAPQLGVASTVSTAYGTAATYASGTTNLLTGSLTRLRAALIGSGGAAAGLAGATLAAGLLAQEVRGLSDATPIAEAPISSLARTVADAAYLVVGPATGFVGAAFSALTGDFEAAKNKFVNTSVEWAKAATQWAARVQAGFLALGQGLITTIRGTIEVADFAWRKGLNGILSFTTDRIDALAGQVERLNSLPGVSLRLARAQAPQVENESLQSRLGRARRQGRNALRGIAARERQQLERFAADTVGGNRRTRSGLGRRARLPRETRTGGGGGDTVINQENNVEIGDQSLNLKDLTPAECRRLAQTIGDELGDSTTNTIGGN
jgi:hypothetical protein